MCGVNQRQHGRQRGLEGAVERQELAAYLLTNRLRAVTRDDAEVALEQFNDRGVRRRLAIRNRSCFYYETSTQSVRIRELPEEAAFPHARVAHDRNEPALAAPHKLKGIVEFLATQWPESESG